MTMVLEHRKASLAGQLKTIMDAQAHNPDFQVTLRRRGERVFRVKAGSGWCERMFKTSWRTPAIHLHIL